MFVPVFRFDGGFGELGLWPAPIENSLVPCRPARIFVAMIMTIVASGSARGKCLRRCFDGGSRTFFFFFHARVDGEGPREMISPIQQIQWIRERPHLEFFRGVDGTEPLRYAVEPPIYARTVLRLPVLLRSATLDARSCRISDQRRGFRGQTNTRRYFY